LVIFGITDMIFWLCSFLKPNGKDKTTTDQESRKSELKRKRLKYEKYLRPKIEYKKNAKKRNSSRGSKMTEREAGKIEIIERKQSWFHRKLQIRRKRRNGKKKENKLERNDSIWSQRTEKIKLEEDLGSSRNVSIFNGSNRDIVKNMRRINSERKELRSPFKGRMMSLRKKNSGMKKG
jgi:hypothetical protein